MKDCSPKGLSQIARGLYPEGPGFLRQLQIYRPYICPFGPLIEAVPQDAHILDIGCGGGLFLGLLASAGRLSRGHGIDTSYAAIAIAQRMLESHPAKDRLMFEHRDAGDPFPEGMFDVVSIVDLLHHVPAAAQQRIFHQAAERVRPGGILLYKDVSRRPLWRAWASRLHDLIIARQWIHIPSFEDILGWAGKAGLEAEKHAMINVLWYGHELGVFRRAGN